MDTVAPAPPAPAVPARRLRASLWALRALLTVQLFAVLALPVLAGLFLTGDVDAITGHGLIGGLLPLLGLLVIGGALAYVLGGRGRLWVLPAAVVLFLAEGLQVGMGYARTLQVHIPLGAAVVTTVVLLAIWVWSPSARRPR
ncbi:hypothetical protein [Pseudonocardia asaccharolytica]|uniref:Integral membrane protein n=1 Tax=Pseudonocardia asaccharolytica DSM 44247 = NBRC 16224 TaxID=1123024 RepID=A0A511D4V7_9PSEU|nr:hypothetical protein [Pseudonocardia asaccharolytica]GEL19801.1 hypothetical protein PA7_36380 [Pseudonocardia asaccharolytica DSM 44247 = NBRC 16224]